MRVRLPVVVIATLAGLLLASGCGEEGGGPGGEAGDPAVFVTAREGACSAGTDGWVRDAGSTINIDFVNERDEPATFVMQRDGASEPLLTHTVGAVTTERLRVEVQEPGPYVMGCGPDEWASLRIAVEPR